MDILPQNSEVLYQDAVLLRIYYRRGLCEMPATLCGIIYIHTSQTQELEMV
jgi:hypothetical protein